MEAWLPGEDSGSPRQVFRGVCGGLLRIWVEDSVETVPKIQQEKEGVLFSPDHDWADCVDLRRRHWETWAPWIHHSLMAWLRREAKLQGVVMGGKKRMGLSQAETIRWRFWYGSHLLWERLFVFLLSLGRPFISGSADTWQPCHVIPDLGRSWC